MRKTQLQQFNELQSDLINEEINLDDAELFLIGDGSIIFKDNSFDLNNKNQFKGTLCP